jgi:hypothetical protein
MQRRISVAMTANAVDQVRETGDAVYRAESRRIPATLIPLLGDFDLVEDALQDAIAGLKKPPKGNHEIENPTHNRARPDGADVLCLRAERISALHP